MKDKWPIDKRHPFDSVAKIKKEKRFLRKSELVLIIHEVFLDYLKNNVDDSDETKLILKQLAEQQKERYEMKTNRKHQFHIDEAGFEHYCRVRYAKLHSHIVRMIDQLFAQVLEERKNAG